MTGIGHNRGPSMESGASWRRFAWRKARRELLPVLPVEVVRMRVRRARELGLDYKVYAGVRASTGRDLVAFLFSSNALQIYANKVGVAQALKISALRNSKRLVLVHPPNDPRQIERFNAECIDAAALAPTLADSWSALREKFARPLGNVPRDGVLVVGSTGFEREWCDAGRLAGYLASERYFLD